jgi:uncharacterized protein with GYD domain
MAKYLFQVRYTMQGAKGIASEGATGRIAAVEKMAASVGGKIESFYFAFGGVDAYVIADLPDHESATAIALTVNQAGGATVDTVVLVTPDQVDRAAKMSVQYRPPGK